MSLLRNMNSSNGISRSRVSQFLYLAKKKTTKKNKKKKKQTNKKKKKKKKVTIASEKYTAEH